MRLPTIALAALLPLLTSAIAIPDTTPYSDGSVPIVYNNKRSPSSTSTSSAAAATYTVKVGGLEGNVIGGKPILRYDPEYIDGKVGDVVAFELLANNHTATQADFATPCVPKVGAFNSGFMPNTENILGAVTSLFTIKDTNPAWFYCAQPGNGKPHCQAGMVFAINPPKSGNKTLEAFRSAAALVPVAATPSASPTLSTTSAPPASSVTSAYTPASSTNSGYTSRTTHLVKIGGRGQDGKPILKYDPETVNANTGDIIKFNFLLANHTATQSSFDTPCNGIAGGFKTGVQSNPGNVDGLVVREFLVVNDKPVWFYCGFATHCQQGMVFAVNPGDKFAEFKAKALASTPKNATSTSTATATATGAPGAKQTYYVTVGGLGSDGKPMLRYSPENVVAKAGDIIEFNFRAANHTATQSSFDNPCTGVDGLFKTGVQMNPNDINGLILKQFEVKDDKPTWFYCGVATHCQQGMVFAVNPGNKFDEFKAKAKASSPKTTGTMNATATATATATGTGALGARQTHRVTIGGLGADGKPMLRYNPENVVAKVGDIVEFDFRAANHTVTQSSFENPCTGVDGLFKTGVQMNPNDTDNLILKSFEVKDDKPAWFYCGVPTHCQKGMVFAVNPGDKFSDFKSRAMASLPKTAISSSPAVTTTSEYAYAQPTGPVTHIIIVGGLSNDGKTQMLRYMPDNVIAKPGDKILFDFKAANHTATQSLLDKPCQALDGGFKSGVRMNPTDIIGFEMFEIEVKDVNPIWVYCGVANHCQKGMVFAVNPGDKLSAFQQNARNSTQKLP